MADAKGGFWNDPGKIAMLSYALNAMGKQINPQNRLAQSVDQMLKSLQLSMLLGGKNPYAAIDEEGGLGSLSGSEQLSSPFDLLGKHGGIMSLGGLSSTPQGARGEHNMLSNPIFGIGNRGGMPEDISGILKALETQDLYGWR